MRDKVVKCSPLVGSILGIIEFVIIYVIRILSSLYTD